MIYALGLHILILSSFTDIRVGWDWDRSRASKLFKYSISLIGSDDIDMTYPLPGS